MKLSEYLNYLIEPLQFSWQNKETLIAISYIASFFYCAIDLVSSGMTQLASILIVNISFILAYFILTFSDLIVGIYANVFVNKQDFKSSKFLKKIFVISLGLIMIYLTNNLSQTFLTYNNYNNILLESLLHTIVIFFEGIKISLLIAFVIYEITSLREKFQLMGHNDIVAILDVFLIPFKKLQKFTSRKINNIIDESPKQN